MLLKISNLEAAEINMAILIMVVIWLAVITFKGKKWFKRDKLSASYLNIFTKLRGIEFAPNAIITIDIGGAVVSWNKGAEIMFGWKEIEMVGRQLTEIMPERYRELHMRGMRRAAQGNESKLIGRTVEVDGLSKAGVEFPIELTLWQWREESNVFYTGIIRDVTEERKSKKEITDILDLYYIGENLDDTGVWKWDVLLDIVTTSRGFRRIFDVDEGTETSSYFLKKIYYEDKTVVEATIKEAFRTKEGYKLEYRIVASDGRVRSLRCTAITKLDNSGDLIAIYGVIQLLKPQQDGAMVS